jgi:maleate isomerase
MGEDGTMANESRQAGEDGRVLLGMLTPSSNTVLEPVCAEILRGLPEISAHFSRFRVTSIALDESSLGQFEPGPMLEAASLLADARVRSICWNGTSASWLGLDADRKLCTAIEERTGTPATSAVLALAEIFRRTGVRRFGLVTPYTGDVQARIAANLGREGFECVADRRLDIADNFSFSRASAEVLAGMVREVAAARPQAITVLCTNLRGAPLVEALERETGIPIHDSVNAALWASLRVAGVDPGRVAGWGSLFGTPA